MADTGDNKTGNRKVTRKTTNRKKPAAKKAIANTTTTRKKSPAARKKTAAKSREALTKQLKADLEVAKLALKQAQAVASEEIKLAKIAAKDEIDVLRDQLAAALKHEKQFRLKSEKKIKKLLIAGERWEKKQLARIKKAANEAKKNIDKQREKK